MGMGEPEMAGAGALAPNVGGPDGDRAARPRLAMAVGRSRPSLHVMSVERLAQHRDWDAEEVDLVDEDGQPLVQEGTGDDATLVVDGQGDVDEARRRLLEMARLLSEAVTRGQLAADHQDIHVALAQIPDLDGDLPALMAYFADPRPDDMRMGHRGGFWHNLAHAAFG